MPRSLHCGRVRRLGLRGADEPIAVTAVPGIDRHCDREPWTQASGERTGCRERDPYRHALNDLGEIPSRVVRRQQAELGAARRGEALDAAIDGEIRIGVDRYLGELPRP